MTKVLTLVSKGVLGLALTALIGYIIKFEHRIDDVIDAYFTSKN